MIVIKVDIERPEKTFKSHSDPSSIGFNNAMDRVLDSDKKICFKCGTINTPLLRHDTDRNVLCRKCYDKYLYSKNKDKVSDHLCECGRCDQFTKLYRGKPRRFIEDHRSRGKNIPGCFTKGNIPWNSETKGLQANSMKGKHYPPEKIRAISGESHYYWKGDDVCYTALHAWIHKHLPRPVDDKCEICKEAQLYDVCNISNELNIIKRYKAHDPVILATYNRDFKNWRWCCRRCHQINDGRLDKFTLVGKSNKGKLRL
ncbi:MAG: hypothetical protein M3P08_07685 [Thermoproteota archaeon]|nr:hypothetical protein [Thermoproteota archaeon]